MCSYHDDCSEKAQNLFRKEFQTKLHFQLYVFINHSRMDFVHYNDIRVSIAIHMLSSQYTVSLSECYIHVVCVCLCMCDANNSN